MRKVNKSFILLLTLSLILGRLCAPIPALAADKITKIEPQAMSTPEEDIAKLATKEKMPKYTAWIAGLVGVALLAALGGGGGGGGSSSSDNTSSDGSVSVGW